MDTAKLADSWIKDGLKKRRANFSNVICFETRDPVRHQQLVNVFLEKTDYRDAEMYRYESWRGLSCYRRAEPPDKGKFEP
ncbi:MAG: hypothetical protein ACREQY_19900 [Candidatus Binatia bacterium]